MSKTKRVKLFDRIKDDIQSIKKIDVRTKTNNQVYVEYRALFIRMVHLIYDLKRTEYKKKEVNQSHVAEYLNLSHSSVSLNLEKFKIYLPTSKHGLQTAYALLKEKYYFMLMQNNKNYDRTKELTYLKELVEKVNNKLAEIIKYDEQL